MPAWKRPRTSTSAKAGSSSSRYSLDRVLAEMPGVVRLLGTLGRQGEPVGGRDEGERRRRADRARAARSTSSMCSIVCRKTIASQRPGDVLDQVALEAQVGPPVARRGMLVGLGIGVDPDHLGSASRPARRSVSLTASQIGDPQASDLPRRSTRRRRGGAGTSSSPPERREGCARRSAPAAGRRRADRAAGSAFPTRVEEVTAGGRYSPALCQRLPTPPPSGSRTSTPAITTLAADELRRQVGNRLRRNRAGAGATKLRKALGGRARAARRRARDRRRNRLLLAQPDDRRGDRAA